jgi:hypothetical protein
MFRNYEECLKIVTAFSSLIGINTLCECCNSNYKCPRFIGYSRDPLFTKSYICSAIETLLTDHYTFNERLALKITVNAHNIDNLNDRLAEMLDNTYSFDKESLINLEYMRMGKEEFKKIRSVVLDPNYIRTFSFYNRFNLDKLREVK